MCNLKNMVGPKYSELCKFWREEEDNSTSMWRSCLSSEINEAKELMMCCKDHVAEHSIDCKASLTALYRTPEVYRILEVKELDGATGRTWSEWATLYFSQELRPRKVIYNIEKNILLLELRNSGYTSLGETLICRQTIRLCGSILIPYQSYTILLWHVKHRWRGEECGNHEPGKNTLE